MDNETILKLETIPPVAVGWLALKGGLQQHYWQRSRTSGNVFCCDGIEVGSYLIEYNNDLPVCPLCKKFYDALRSK